MKNNRRLILCILGCGTITMLSVFINTSCLFDGGSCDRKNMPLATIQMYRVAPNSRSQRSRLGGITLTFTEAPSTELPTGQEAANSIEVPVYEAMEDALRARHMVDPKTGAKVIIMSSLDSGYVEMGLNLWETSFRKFGIENYLFVCTDKQARLDFAKHGLSCFQGKEIEGADKASDYGSAAFSSKTHLKTEITLQALRLGYTVLLVDVDIVFLKNPFPYFTCDDCDLQIQSDGVEINSGFLLAKPTQAAIELHEKALQMAHKTKLSNQKTLAHTLEKMVENTTIKVKILSDMEFPRGNVFYESGRRMFATDAPCRTCVIIHNNWIVSGAAKIYRFKEFLMWMVDTDGYYSNADAKYFTYSNPIDFGAEGDSAKRERETLRTALRLGYLLNRTLILPEFHCHGCRVGACKNEVDHCSLNTYIRMSVFDKNMKNRYREHMFLRHQKVPESVLNSQSKIIKIATNVTGANHAKWKVKMIDSEVSFTPADPVGGATGEELLRWLEPYEGYSVLRFHSLYNAFKGFSPGEGAEDFEQRLEAAMAEAGYRQYA